MEDLLIEHQNYSGIPLLICAKNNQTPKKAIFLFHRLLQSKEFELPLAHALANAGYYVILLDFKGHGARENSFNLSRKYDFDLLFSDVVGMVDDIRAVLTMLRERGRSDVDLTSIGMMGVSVGGMVALTAAYMLKEVQFAVSLISSACWWPLVEQDSFCSFRFFSTSRHVMAPERVKAVVDQYDPFHNIEKLDYKPILMLNGTMDMAIPMKEVTPFYEKLSKHYQEQAVGERVCWKKYSKCGHEVTPWMIHDILEWLKEWGD